MHKDAKIFENHLNSVMLLLIGKLSLSTLRWVPVCQDFSHFSGFLHQYVLAQLASSIRVMKGIHLARGEFSLVWFSSCSTGHCSGPSTLINVVGKRNLNGINVYLRWRSERDTLYQRWSTFMVLNKAHVEPEAKPNQRKPAPDRWI